MYAYFRLAHWDHVRLSLHKTHDRDAEFDCVIVFILGVANTLLGDRSVSDGCSGALYLFVGHSAW